MANRKSIPGMPASLRAEFASYPPKIRAKLKELRRLIYETAAVSDVVGEITETLKWGQPAYLTSASKSGSTIRIGWKASEPTRYAMYFNCQTSLIDTFRTLFPGEFTLEGNRAIVFEQSETVPTNALAICIDAALTYHCWKKSRKKGDMPFAGKRVRQNEG